MSALLEQGADYILHSFAAHATGATTARLPSSSSTLRVRVTTDLRAAVAGVLLVGRQGSGRTSVARAIAQSVERNSRVYARA